ncbi:MAG: hypothetical protein R3359_04575 [Marinirhabdus sp.]|nr:hypothetical protein [Marinirhabdus sp.]
MKTKLILVALPIALVGFFASSFVNAEDYPTTTRTLQPESGCVFMTTMGEQSSDGFAVFKTDENVNLSVRDGLAWLAAAQLANGGYGAGSHSAQHLRDPHAVAADPATTAMVAQAFLRSGSTFRKGVYAENLKKATHYLVETILNTAPSSPYITDVRNTQIQRKLGENIDAVLAAQFLSNLLNRNVKGTNTQELRRALAICVSKIEAGTDATGRQKGAGWAGVLQSGLANSALEAAQSVGAEVDDAVLEKARQYQKQNYDEQNGAVKTEDGAGVMLYSVSGSARASAIQARKAKEQINKAKREGKLDAEAEINVENLKIAGYSQSQALGYKTAYDVYESAKNTAQREDVVTGYGNNGGEEFLSFLQTGESMVVNDDTDWKSWYDNMSGRILKIQNADGSWNGHHCITSPVFCTATSVLLLTIENDIQFLRNIGE